MRKLLFESIKDNARQLLILNLVMAEAETAANDNKIILHEEKKVNISVYCSCRAAEQVLTRPTTMK